MIKRLFLIALAVALVAALPVAAGEHSSKGDYAKQADIIDTAVAAGSFDTLVAAVKAAGLVDALKADGPFTVFAPTDEAFAKLPAGTVESLLLPENRDKLQSILTYHVVPSRVLAADVADGASAPTLLDGQSLEFTIADGKVLIGESEVIQTDIMTSNGVIHVVDSVLLPR